MVRPMTALSMQRPAEVVSGQRDADMIDH